MISSLLGLLIWMQNPEEWKTQTYEKIYNQAIIKSEQNIKRSTLPTRKEILRNVSNQQTAQGTISWYDSGRYKDGTEFKGDKLTCACFKKDRGKTFRVTYGGNSVNVKCNDSGAFEFNGSGRVLDLSVSAFEKLAPRSQGVIRGAKIIILE